MAPSFGSPLRASLKPAIAVRKKTSARLQSYVESSRRVLVFWLASCQTAKPLHEKSHPAVRDWDSVFPFRGISCTFSSFIAFVAGVIVFSNSVNGKFVFDDSEAVVNNQDVLAETPVSNILFNDFWGTPLSHNRSHKSYRPVTVLTFRWNVWMAGGLQPFGFHFSNVLLHGIVSALVVPVANNLFGGHAPRMSLLTSLLFAVHPVHTEAVAGVVGRADLLCAFFSFLSFLTYVKATEAHTLHLLILSLSGAIIFCSLALFSKEQGLTVLGMCLAYDIIVFQKLPIFHFIISPTYKLSGWLVEKLKVKSKLVVLELSEPVNNKAEKKQYPDKKLFIIRFVVVVLTGLFLLYLRWRVMGSKPPSFQKVDNPASFHKNFWTRVRTFNYLYTLNAWLFLCPEWLSFDWSMGCVRLLSEPSDPRLLAVIVFWICLVGLVWRGISSANSNVGRTVTMALAVTVISFLPASNLFFRVGFVLAERVLYLPSLGFCMLVVLGVQVLLEKTTYKKTLTALFFCTLILFSGRSFQRSEEWLDERTLFQSALSVCPLNAKVHYNVAKNAGDRGDQEVAVKEYRIALKLHAEYDQAMNNLANILRDTGKLSEAESLLRKAIKIRPDFAAAWMNLGIVLAGLKQHKEAETCYSTALLHRSQYPECLYNLGNLYLDLKLHSEALKVFKKAVEQRPTFSIAWNNMVIMLESLGNLREAMNVAYRALSILPNDAGLHFNLANTLGKLSMFPDAEEHFKKAITFSPGNAIYHSNMGVLYHRWKKYELAERKYKDALQLDPLLNSAVTNLAMLKRSQSTVIS